jgi:hypothetical protein
MRPRLTYANVMATIAVFMALGGGAYAAVKISGTSIKPHSIPLNRLKGTLPAGAPGAKGDPGADGAPGTALAYGHVHGDGTLDAANSKNISSSDPLDPGYYCVTSSVPIHNIVVTLDIAGTFGYAAASFEDPFIECPEGAIVVTTFNFEQKLKPIPFYIAIN